MAGVMKVKDEVSVVTTSMNYGQYLVDNIESVANQRTNFRYRLHHIVTDGGSEDETPQLLEQYSKAYPHIYYEINLGEGQTEALNHAMRIIETKFPKTNVLGWLNADDYYTPQWLQSTIEVLRAEPKVAVVYGNHGQVGLPNDRQQAADIKTQQRSQRGKSYVHVNNMKRGNMVCQPTVLIRMSAFEVIKEKYGYWFNPNRQFAQDVDLWARFLVEGYQICKIPVVTAILRRHPKRMTHRIRPQQKAEGDAIRAWLRRVA